MRGLIFTFIFSFSIFVFGQKPEKVWDHETVKKANTASDAVFLTEKEKQVVFYLNLVRIDPRLFSSTYLKKYLDSTKIQNQYTKSLKKTLENTPAMGILQPQSDLSKIAKEHAIQFGKQSKTGHGNFSERIKNVRQKYGQYLGENCDYGNHTPLEIVIRLLIDENVKGLGHRENILDPKYKYVGVAIQPHKKYGSNCVMEFGG